MAEAAGAPDSLPGEEYECKICYDYFDLDRRAPKLLGCSHTFCRECLDALHLREGRGCRIGCPVCRHRTPVPAYRVDNLPDNAALAAALPLQTHVPADSPGSGAQTGPDVSPVTDSCHTCRQVAFVAGCACAIFCFLCMVVLLFLGLIFVHNFNSGAASVGHVCLSVASVLALLSLILTWLMCVLKYRPETEASNFSSLTYVTGQTKSGSQAHHEQKNIKNRYVARIGVALGPHPGARPGVGAHRRAPGCRVPWAHGGHPAGGRSMRGRVQCGLGSSRGGGPRRPNPWTKTLAIGTWNVTSLGGKEPELKCAGGREVPARDSRAHLHA
ncbi:hypothetical protein L3Q82_006185 [Scortum barcoo]|uniref:Uncharacterized protein n=1 Tax=Scortum barcoo TaxID=214431 RepID=A0ACB8X479_9TELE|nr:hypothetical protein L3Q82_006185 [Scortum barcoo]